MRLSLQILCATLAFTTCGIRFLAAQSEQGMNLLNKDNWQAAEVAFRADIQRNRNLPLAWYGLSRMYAHPRFEGKDLDSAYAHIERAERAFRKLSPKQREKVAKKQKLTSKLLSEQRQILTDQAAERILAAGTIEACDTYLQRYTRASAQSKRKIYELRHALVLDKARQSSGKETVLQLLKDYGESMETETPAVFRQMQVLLFERSMEQDGIGAFPAFRRQFPDNVVSRDSLAVQVERALTNPEVEPLELLADKYPQSIFHRYLLDELATRIAARGAEASCQKFVQQYPQHKDAPAVWNRYYDLVRRQATRPEQLEQFLRDNLAFPDPEQVKRDIAALEPLRGKPIIQKPINPNLQKPLNELKPEDLNRREFAPLINTQQDDYAPILSADGRTLYLCRQHNGSEDIFVSYQNAQGEWSEPKPENAWNTSDKSEAPESISADGNRFYLFRQGKFHVSQRTSKYWSTPTPLPPPFNQFNWQADLSISSDGKAMLFAAGSSVWNSDIYVCLQNDEGKWGQPISLGATINTARPDRSPFIHPDGKTLYFSSQGHGGLGDFDIYMSKRLDDTWTNWSKPVNLGPAINTKGSDWGFRVSTDGAFAYYSANLNGNSDIVRCDLPAAAKPETVATVAGRMTDIKGNPLDAEILWEDLRSGEVVQITRTNPATGEFFAVLPERGRYGYSVRKPGYFPLAGNVDLRNELGEIRLDKPMQLATLEEMRTRNMPLPLNNLFFETGKHQIQPESYPELNRLAALVIKEKLHIEIQGHTDNVGTDVANQQLSENRANAVRQYLVNKGCSPAQIEARGFGENAPKASNATEEGRALNRRVEIRIRG